MDIIMEHITYTTKGTCSRQIIFEIEDGKVKNVQYIGGCNGNLKGILGTSSFDAPGVARAIAELGLSGKVFTAGTGMPGDNAELLKSGAVQYLTLWDPALAGQAMVALAEKVLNGEEIVAPVDLGVEGYGALQFSTETVLEGQGWITITAENVDSFGF